MLASVKKLHACENKVDHVKNELIQNCCDVGLNLNCLFYIKEQKVEYHFGNTFSLFFSDY